jgi:hypothetical protein
MKIIYVDMDGVLCNFDKAFKSKYGALTRELNEKDKRTSWNDFINNGGFATLEWFDGGQELVDFLNSLTNIQKCILSSAGGFDRHRDVMSQKLSWLSANDVKWPAVIVPGRKYKAGFANGNSFMIDDTPDVIKSFCANGGNGCLHTDAKVTIDVIRKWISPVHSTPWM